MQARNRIGDRYELTYPIGRGGMGEVWAGYDERLDRPVAIKFLRQSEVPADERTTAAKRFRREARVTARLDHPGVPIVHDLGVHGDDLYIVMQLVQGVVLADVIAEEGPLPVSRAASIAAQICSVLATAHTASLIHRDLKPQNVIVTSTGLAKVLDFGIAALLGPADASRLTTTGRMLGTAAYVAPEQASGNLVGPAVDLYALGCILFEMLTGRPPYQGRNAPDLLRQHMHEPVPVVTHLRTDVPDDLAHLVFCLLAKDPQGRPASAGDVCQLLVQFIEATDAAAARHRGLASPYHDLLRPVPARAGASGPTEGVLPSQRSGRPTELSTAELARILDQARELAESERFTQAAEVLGDALRSLPASDPRDPTTLKLRLEVADLQLLAGAYREALAQFVSLIRDLADAVAPDMGLISYYEHQASVCRAELGESARRTGSEASALYRRGPSSDAED